MPSGQGKRMAKQVMGWLGVGKGVFSGLDLEIGHSFQLGVAWITSPNPLMLLITNFIIVITTEQKELIKDRR